MTASRTVPSRIDEWAQALLRPARAEGIHGQIETELMAVLGFLRTQDALRQFLGSPTVRNRGKRAAFTDLMTNRIHPLLLLFLLNLIETGSIEDLTPVAERFFEQLAATEQKLAAEVISARPLSADRVRRLEDHLAGQLGKPVRLRVRVDSTLLGGLRVRAGDHIIDATVERQLEAMRDALLAER